MNFPYELHRVPGSQAVAKLEELRQTGVAVILGGSDSFERVVENMENGADDPDALIASSMQIDPVVWLREREEADPEYYEDEEEESPEAAEPNSELISHRDVLSGEPLDEVLLAVLPAKESWMAPCYLRTGGWNSMPFAAEHAALFRHWGKRYGATVACIADDVIEFTVANPPKTKEDAMALAKEHFVYCADIVHQGVGSLDALAATLLNAPVWYFWWD
jgi:hypothetical protein